jgi:hypothetical protein
MKKIAFTAAAAFTALVAAAPASAQGYYGYPQPAPYGNAYGYNNNYGQVRSLQARVDNVQRQITQLDRRRILSNKESRSLQSQARNIEYRLRRIGYNGLNYNEVRSLDQQIRNLEYRVQREARDGNGRYGQNWNDRDRDGVRDGRDGWIDRDRDGRDDRFEPHR